ncbi:nitroreductase/quinone reductase family protein [Allokutzneria albata]|uniref:Deazaflavin-dependent oxidoreductase, nitroreductase family n=1 Tax=Allokutzneria albata TaxID=211114 RepID=A0A1H0BPA5_ALLAB|nr:nitroreductase/quinone reductase family protein [Allokutzneria albata]SDN47500.1 deazaflavin-dependent oxidoreductase, nitroreductase family [Allokutzneria albata]
MTDSSDEFDFTDFQQKIIAEFRANGGRVGGMFEGATLALLTTTGARSGLPRTSPLGYLEIDGQPVVIASAMGAPSHPAWYHNIRKDPAVTVEIGTETYEAVAGIPTGAERDRLFAKAVEQAPGYGDYQEKTTRVIPVVTLHRVDAGAGGLGGFLVEVHDWLRAELATLLDEVDEIVAGRASGDLVVQLRAHCLEFCGALSKHHTGEDHGAFPMLAQRFPALAPALEKLGDDHKTVARLQEEITSLVEGYTPGESDPVRLREELSTLTALLEAHFAYEEKTVVTALNALSPAPQG